MKLRVLVAVYLYIVFYQWNNRMVVVPNILGLISVGYFIAVELYSRWHNAVHLSCTRVVKK